METLVPLGLLMGKLGEGETDDSVPPTYGIVCEIPYTFCAFWVNACSWRKIKGKSRCVSLSLSA